MKKKAFHGENSDVESLNETILELDFGALKEISDEYLELAIGALYSSTSVGVGETTCTQLSCTGYFPVE